MTNSFNPSVNFQSQMRASMGNSFSMNRMSEMSEVEGAGSFQNVMKGMISNLDNTLSKPDKLLADAVSGTGNVDVHDVMIAMSKAELSLTVATNVVSKVIQAYDKISQISV